VVNASLPPFFYAMSDKTTILQLYELDEKTLNYVISMSESDKTAYFHTVISRFYSHVEPGNPMYDKLQLAYRASWTLEKIYRNNKIIREGITLVYTTTGLIREAVNDVYYNKEALTIH